MAKLLQEQDFVYSLPMLFVMVVKRLFRNLTQRTRDVNMEIEYGSMPAPERQHISGHKWQYFVTLNFNRQVPPIGWDQTSDFNEFLLMTETDRVLIGVYFVSIFTDNPSKYNPDDLALAACNAFGLNLKHLEHVHNGADELI